MSNQRPYFLSTFLSAFRQQTAPPLSQQPNKHTSPSASASQTTTYTASSNPRTVPGASSSAAHQAAGRSSASGGVMSQLHSPRGAAVPIPGNNSGGRRRGSDSSSEGFRDVLGTEKWYIGGRTMTGEERFFKLGTVRRVKSNDGLSLDRLSL